jgi:hypothetical protein
LLQVETLQTWNTAPSGIGFLQALQRRQAGAGLKAPSSIRGWRRLEQAAAPGSGGAPQRAARRRGRDTVLERLRERRAGGLSR